MSSASLAALSSSLTSWSSACASSRSLVTIWISRSGERAVRLTILPYPSHAEDNHASIKLTARLAPSYPIMPPRLTLEDAKGLTSDEVAELTRLLEAHVSEHAVQTLHVVCTQSTGHGELLHACISSSEGQT